MYGIQTQRVQLPEKLSPNLFYLHQLSGLSQSLKMVGYIPNEIDSFILLILILTKRSKRINDEYKTAAGFDLEYQFFDQHLL
jgi:hypothetical protein